MSISMSDHTTGIMIAAPWSGSGKTTFTVGLLWALKKRGQNIRCFKCGPDYIDPMYHTQTLGVPCRNLDTWFTDAQTTQRLFAADMLPGDNTLSVIEGVMGLYDGVAGTEMEGSSYDLARVLGLPILLVVPVRGMGRSVIALIRGFQSMDPEGLIRGVILNQISEALYQRLAPLIEEETGISCLGFLPKEEKLSVPGRYLGLTLPEGAEQGKWDADYVRTAGELVQSQLDWERFFTICGGQEPVDEEEHVTNELVDITADDSKTKSDTDKQDSLDLQFRPTLAVARDEAFSFLYEDNLRVLRKQGIDLCFFSPLHDEKLPEGISGLLLSGGYPELYAAVLSDNVSMREDIREKVGKGLPTVAECGGFLYLQEQLKDPEGRLFPMVGAIPGTSFCTGHSVRFGYMEAEEYEPAFLPQGLKLKGHEFHYYDTTENGTSCRIVKPVTGRSWTGVVTTETLWAGFPHIYYPAEPRFAECFAEKMLRYQKNFG